MEPTTSGGVKSTSNTLLLTGAVATAWYCKQDHVLLFTRDLGIGDSNGFTAVPVLGDDETQGIIMRYTRFWDVMKKLYAGHLYTDNQLATLLHYAKLLQHLNRTHDANNPDSFCTWSRSLNEPLFSSLYEVYNDVLHGYKRDVDRLASEQTRSRFIRAIREYGGGIDESYAVTYAIGA